MSVLSDATGNVHKILDRATTDEITKQALQEIDNEDVEMS